MVRVAHKLHHIRPAAPLLVVPQTQTLRPQVGVDEPADCRPKCLLLVAADPDEIPVRALQARRERRAQASASADTDTACVERRCVRDTGKLELACPDRRGRVIDEVAREVALHAADQVVVLRVNALGNDAKGVVLADDRGQRLCCIVAERVCLISPP